MLFCSLVFSMAYKLISTVCTMLWVAKRSYFLRGQIQILAHYTAELRAERWLNVSDRQNRLRFPGTNNVSLCKVKITIGLLVNSCNGKHHHSSESSRFTNGYKKRQEEKEKHKMNSAVDAQNLKPPVRSMTRWGSYRSLISRSRGTFSP